MIETYSSEYIDRFKADPDFRSTHRQEKLDELAAPDGRILRGKRRPVLVYHPEQRPAQMPHERLVRLLGKRMKTRAQQGLPLMDHVTRTHTFIADVRGYERYIAGAKKRTISPPKDGDNTRDLRQELHVRDNTLLNVLTYMRAAKLRSLGLSTVMQAKRDWQPFHKSAALHVADAIEDLGSCLYDNPKITEKIDGAENLAAEIQHIGYYSAEDPEFLRRVSTGLFSIALAEQKVRNRFWEQRLDVIMYVDGDQRTTADRQHAAALGEMAAEFSGVKVVEFV